MTKTILTVLALFAVAFTATACQSAPTTLPPGEYKKTSESTDANGTTTKTTTKTDVSRNSDGTKSATVKKETSTDPKGLFNKSTSTKTETYNQH